MTWLARSGNCRTRSSNTSPTVDPLAFTDDWPAACWRRTVGRRTSTGTAGEPPATDGRTNEILLNSWPFEDEGLLGHLPLDDREGPHHRRRMLHRRHDVVPRGVGSLGDVRRRRVRLGVGVGVVDADDLPPLLAGV